MISTESRPSVHQWLAAMPIEGYPLIGVTGSREPYSIWQNAATLTLRTLRVYHSIASNDFLPLCSVELRSTYWWFVSNAIGEASR
jgi:hypothetical protein